MIRPLLLALLLSSAANADTLRVGRVSGSPSQGNPFTSVGQPSSGVWSAMYDGLTAIDENGKLQPALSLSWTVEAPTRWVFKLRPGVTFHNGAPFTASSVVKVIEFLKTEEGKRLYVGAETAGITAVRARDDLTVEMTTAKPDPLLAKRMNLVYMPEPGALAQGLESLAKAPVGTGAFKLTSWGNGNARNVFEADPKSWRASRGVTKLELLAISDASARLQALMAGQIDVMEGISRDEISALDPDVFHIVTQSVPGMVALAFRNVGNPKSPVQDKRVRQALSLAVNRPAVVEAIFGAGSRAATQGTVQEAVGFSPELSLPYDPAKAKALLAEAGYPKGFPLQIEVITGFGGADRLIYQQAAQDLMAVGINVELRAIPYPSWLAKFTSADWGPVDVFSFSWDASMYYDPIRPIRNSSCAKVNPFFCLPDVMPLIEATDVEMDEAARAAKMRALMAKLNEEAAAIWIGSGTVNIAAAKRVGNVRWRAPGLMYEAVTVGK
jgi:peptide/nickel transport system substrate-binding protein